MAILYTKLFELMDKKNLKPYHLRVRGIHAAVMDRLVKNHNVNTLTINNLCRLLNCQPGDIMEYVPDTEPSESDNIHAAEQMVLCPVHIP